MAPRRPTFTGGLINPISVPSVGFEQFSSQATGLGQLNEKLNRVKLFALERGEEDAKRRAATYAAENPIDLNEFLSLKPDERQDLFSKNFTSYDQVINQLRKSELVSEVTTAAKLDLSDFKNQLLMGYAASGTLGIFNQNNQFTELGNEDIAGILNAKIQGYSETVATFDAQEARDLANSLSLEAHDVMEKVYEVEIERLSQSRRENGLAVQNNLLRDIEEGYATHGLSRRAVMVDEKEDILSNDDLQYGRYELERDLLQSRGLSVEEMDKGFEDARQEGLISYFKSYYDIPEITPESAYQVSDAVAKGDFASDNLQMVWDQLSDESKASLRDDVDKWRDGVVAESKREETEAAAQRDKNKATKENELLQAQADGDDDKLQAIIDEVVKNPGDYPDGTQAEFQQAIINRDDDPINNETYNEMKNDIVNNDMTYAELQFMYDIGIDLNGDGIVDSLNYAQYIDLKTQLNDSINSGVKDQKDIFKQNIGATEAEIALATGLSGGKDVKNIILQSKRGSKILQYFSEGRQDVSNLEYDGKTYNDLIAEYGLGDQLKIDGEGIVDANNKPVLKMKPTLEDIIGLRFKLEDSTGTKANAITDAIETQTNKVIVKSNTKIDLQEFLVDPSFGVIFKNYADQKGSQLKWPGDTTNMKFVLDNKTFMLKMLEDIDDTDINGEYVYTGVNNFLSAGYEPGVFGQVKDLVTLLREQE